MGLLCMKLCWGKPVGKPVPPKKRFWRGKVSPKCLKMSYLPYLSTCIEATEVMGWAKWDFCITFSHSSPTPLFLFIIIFTSVRWYKAQIYKEGLLQSSLWRTWVYDKMRQKNPLLQSCSSQFFRFISGTARVKQVGKEKLSAAFPEVLCQPASSQMSVLLNNP